MRIKITPPCAGIATRDLAETIKISSKSIEVRIDDRIGPKFLQEDGTLTREIMPDFLHLSPKGYQIWADNVKGPINDLLKK